jgi:MFS family permease
MPEALADPNFRRFLTFRVLLSLSTLLDPFLIIFAATNFGLVTADIGGYVGGYIIAFVLGRLAFTPVWAALARRHGEKSSLQVAALVRLLPPLLALILPYLGATDLYRDRLSDRVSLATLFGIAFVALGAAVAGQGRGNFGYLEEVAPIRLRAAYAGLTNAVLALVAFVPVVGGLILDRSGFDALFLTAALLGLIAVFASGALTDTYVRTHPTAEAWRMRRTTTAAAEARRR